MPMKREPVSPRAYEAMKSMDVDKMLKLTDEELRPILPCLVRMSLCNQLDSSKDWIAGRRLVLKILTELEAVNSFVSLLSVDFHALEQDAKKELHFRQKLGESEGSSSSARSSLFSQRGIVMEFEKNEAVRRLRLVVIELIRIMGHIKEPPTHSEFSKYSSELFEVEIYLEDISDVLAVAQAELPLLLPLDKVAEALLRVKHGAWLLCRLVANSPDSFGEVCRSLVKNGEKQDEDSLGGRRRVEAVRLLCNMNPAESLAVRAMAVEYCRLPSLAIRLTLDHSQRTGGGPDTRPEDPAGASDSAVGDLVSFISGILLGTDGNVRNWFSQFVRNGQKRKSNPELSTLHGLRQRLLAELHSIIPSKGSQLQQVVLGSAFIRLYAALHGIAGMKFSQDESEELLRLLTCHPPPSAAGIRFVSLGLCFLLASPYLIYHPNQENHAVSWVKWLVEEQSHFESASGVFASFGELLLLLAIHFHANQMQAISDLICSTLGMKISVKSNSLARMKIIFTQEIFTEQVVTAHAVTVPVTPRLSASIVGFLPVHCIYQLLKSRAFSKHRVPIKDWIYRQICSTTLPLHPLLPPLLEVFLHSVVTPTKTHRNRNVPFTQEEVMAVFESTPSGGGDPMEVDVADSEGGPTAEDTTQGLRTQLLMLYYLMLYEDYLTSSVKSTGHHHAPPESERLKSYPPRMLAQVPTQYLLLQARKQQKLFAGLYPSLLKLALVHYPHNCGVEDWLREETVIDTSILQHVIYPGSKALCTPQQLQKAFDEVRSDGGGSLVSCLEHLVNVEAAAAGKLADYAQALVGNLPALLAPGVPRRVLDLAVSLWYSLNTILARRLWVMTVVALSSNKQRIRPFTEEDNTLDPLIVLRCDDRVFRCPPILDIVLQLLSSYLAASKAHYAKLIKLALTNKKGGEVAGANNSQKAQSGTEREEMKNALVAIQDSTAVQILLEVCLPLPGEKESDNPNLHEIRHLVCSWIHQMFIAEPNIAKLVHFQGYRRELLPVTAKGIPSLHICLDFLPELMTQPYLEKQVFAIDLVSHLCLQYSLPKSLSVARLAVNLLSTLLSVLPSQKRYQLFMPVLPSLVRMCRAFSPLYDDITSILVQLDKICLSHQAIHQITLAKGQERNGEHPSLYYAIKEGQELVLTASQARNCQLELRLGAARAYREIVEDRQTAGQREPPWRKVLADRRESQLLASCSEEMP